MLETKTVVHKIFIQVFCKSFTHQQAIVFDDAQLFGPLAQPLLSPQEGTDPSVLHQLDGGLRRWPLMLRRWRLSSGHLLLIVGLVRTANRLPII